MCGGKEPPACTTSPGTHPESPTQSLSEHCQQQTHSNCKEWSPWLESGGGAPGPWVLAEGQLVLSHSRTGSKWLQAIQNMSKWGHYALRMKHMLAEPESHQLVSKTNGYSRCKISFLYLDCHKILHRFGLETLVNICLLLNGVRKWMPYDKCTSSSSAFSFIWGQS